MKNAPVPRTCYRAASFFTPRFPFAVSESRHTRAEFSAHPLGIREFWKITYIAGGSGNLTLFGRSYPLAEGSVYLMRPDYETSYEISAEPLVAVNIVFTEEFLFGKDALPNAPRLPLISNAPQAPGRVPFYMPDAPKAFRNAISELRMEYAAREPNYQFAIRIALYRLLIILQRHADLFPVALSDRQILEDVRKIISDDFAEPLEIGKLAEKFAVSKQHLAYIFKKSTGQTIVEALTGRRLDHAASLLIKSGMQISEICYSCGFNDLSYFYRIFRCRFGCNPGDFRRTRGDDFLRS